VSTPPETTPSPPQHSRQACSSRPTRSVPRSLTHLPVITGRQGRQPIGATAPPAMVRSRWSLDFVQNFMIFEVGSTGHQWRPTCNIPISYPPAWCDKLALAQKGRTNHPLAALKQPGLASRTASTAMRDQRTRWFTTSHPPTVCSGDHAISQEANPSPPRTSPNKRELPDSREPLPKASRDQFPAACRELPSWVYSNWMIEGCHD